MTTEEKKGRKKKEIPIISEEKKQSKRGRKVKVVDFKKVETLPINNFTLQETVILHLPITLNELVENQLQTKIGIENILTQSPVLPVPYNSIGYNISGKKATSSNVVKKHQDKSTEVKVYMSVDNEGRKMTTSVYSRPLLPTDCTNKDIKVSAQKTDVACWWCCHQFDTYPVCAPIKYNDKKDLFSVVGCFCSFNCAKSHSIQDKRSISLNSFLYKRVTGKLEHIKPAPPKTVLEMFGGPLSIEEYRSTFNTLSTVNINVFPMVFASTQIEYNKIDDSFQKYRSSISKTVLDKRSVDNATNRLSKNKKTPSTNNNLLNLMGIKVKSN